MAFRHPDVTMRRMARIEPITIEFLETAAKEAARPLNEVVAEGLWSIAPDEEVKGKVYIEPAKGPLPGTTVEGVYTLSMPSLLHGIIEAQGRETGKGWEGTVNHALAMYALDIAAVEALRR